MTKTRTIWLLFLLFFAMLYGLTAQKTVAWQDSGEFQFRMKEGDLAGKDCLARSHLPYILFGHGVYRVVPEAFPHSINILTGLFMAVSVANLFALGCLLTKNKIASAIIAITFGLAHTVWWEATIAEVYSMNIMLFVTELLILTRLIRSESKAATWFYLLALCSATHWLTHNFALLAMPVYLLVVFWLVKRGRLAWGHLLVATIGYVVITGSIWWHLWNHLPDSDGRFGMEFIRNIFVGRYGSKVFNWMPVGKYTIPNAFFSALNFMSLLLPLAVVGWWKRFGSTVNRPLAAALAGITVIELLFFVRYNVIDQFTFIIPSLVMIAIAAAVGLDYIMNHWKRGRQVAIVAIVLAVLQPAGYVGAYYATRSRAKRPNASAVRDEARYWIFPWKQNETSAHDWATAVLAIPGEKVIFVDSTTRYPLLLLHLDSAASIQGALPTEAYLQQATPGTQLLVGPRATVPGGWKIIPCRPELKMNQVVRK